MVVNRRKKVTKYRAHTTHGGGHRKKRRGAGNRGGRGRAGSGKRGKARKQSFEKLGKHGFLPRRNKKKIRTINLNSLARLIKNKKIEPQDGVYVVDLTVLKYDKLLGSGKIDLKVQVTVAQFSRQAEEKIVSAGGSITKIENKKETTAVKDENEQSETDSKTIKEEKLGE